MSMFLLNAEAEKMDEPYKWCVPCGYLDWDENGTGEIFRELFEEANLNLDEFLNKNKLAYESLRQPWFVSDSPFSHKQNVTLRYGCCVDANVLPEVSNVNVGKMV